MRLGQSVQKFKTQTVTFHQPAIAPPPKKNFPKLFYLQNDCLDLCSNQTILEIKGVGI